MAFSGPVIGKRKWLIWKTVLVLAIALTDLHVANADVCYKIADCSCQNPTRLLCSGNSPLSISQLRQIVPAAYVLYIDIRGRRISHRFLFNLIVYFPRLKALRIDKTLCTIVLPLIGKFKFTVIHECYGETTTEFHQLSTPFPADVTTKEVFSPSILPHVLTTPFSGEVTTQSEPTITPSPSEVPTTTIIFSTAPVVIHSSPPPPAPNVTRFYPPDIPTAKPGHIVISGGHSAGFYVSIIIPTSTVLSVIVGILACCARWFSNRFVPCFGYRNRHDGSGDDAEAGSSADNVDPSNRQGAEAGPPPPAEKDSVKTDRDRGSGPDGVNASNVLSSRVAVSKKEDGNITIIEMGTLVNKCSDQTYVKIPQPVTNVVPTHLNISTHDITQVKRADSSTASESVTTSAESTLVPRSAESALAQIPESVSISTAGDLGTDTHLSLPSDAIHPATSTPIKGNKKPTFSFMSCFGTGSDGYRALSPASVGTPASVYQTPAAGLSPSAESMVSSAPLIKESPVKEPQYPIRSWNKQFELLQGVEGRKRTSSKAKARKGLQTTVELSASSEDIKSNQT